MFKVVQVIKSSSSNSIDLYQKISQNVLRYVKLNNYDNILFIKGFKNYKKKEELFIRET